MPEPERYQRTEQLLDMALQLQSSFAGLCLDDVMERYDVSRRTADRMLGTVRRALGAHLFDSHVDESGRKYWKLSVPQLTGLFQLQAEELADLEAAAGLARREGNVELARKLSGLQAKLRALSSQTWLRRVDPDFEALSQAQGFAARPGPRPRVDEALLGRIRHALMAGRRLRVLHRKPDGRRASWQSVGPLGLLYGSRHYLVAQSAKRKGPVLFRLSRIEAVEVLEEAFEWPAGFDLGQYAKQSFGVFQEEPVDVVWKFKPGAAEEAREYCFHPDQKVEELADGSLLVRFRAGGMMEMAWHLFTWGDGVEVLAPETLQGVMVEMLRGSLKGVGRKRVGRKGVGSKGVGSKGVAR